MVGGGGEGRGQGDIRDVPQPFPAPQPCWVPATGYCTRCLTTYKPPAHTERQGRGDLDCPVVRSGGQSEQTLTQAQRDPGTATGPDTQDRPLGTTAS